MKKGDDTMCRKKGKLPEGRQADETQEQESTDGGSARRSQTPTEAPDGDSTGRRSAEAAEGKEEKPDEEKAEQKTESKDEKAEGKKESKDEKPEGKKESKDEKPEGEKERKDEKPEGEKESKDEKPEGEKESKDEKPAKKEEEQPPKKGGERPAAEGNEKKKNDSGTASSSARVRDVKDLTRFDPPQKTRSIINQYQYQDNSDLLRYVMVSLYPSAKEEGLYGQDHQADGADSDDKQLAAQLSDQVTDDAHKAISSLAGTKGTGRKSPSSGSRSSMDSDDAGSLNLPEVTEGSSTSSASAPQLKDLLDEEDSLDDDLLLSGAGSAGTKGSSTPIADKATEILGYTTDVLGLLNIGSTTMDLREVYPGTDSNNKPVSVDTIKEQQATARKVFSAFFMLSGGLGATQNILSLYSMNKKGSTTKNQRKRREAESGILQNSLGLLSNLIDFTNAGIGLFGDENNTSQQNAVSALSFIGTIANAGSAFLGLKDGMQDKDDHQEIMDALRKKELGNQNDWDDAIEKASKARLNAVRDKKSDAYLNAKMSHNVLKARKYALQEAAEFHQIKKDQMTKGAIGAVVTGISTIGSLMGYIPGIKDSEFGQVVKAVNPLFSTIGGYFAKYGEKASDAKAETKIKEKKKRIIEDYITKKSAKIQEQANQAFKNHPLADFFKNLTQDQKERIVVARLGVNIDITDNALSEDDKLKAFEARNKKQALAIMNSGKQDKETILTALKLDTNASLEEIQSALTGD